ncbi:hypothetical protein B0H13DRAFT_2479678 [Mycena leptocephala]|nr:hypothetical protein B0H13DRAFT_2479678 [Mycena leptocephala]
MDPGMWPGSHCGRQLKVQTNRTVPDRGPGGLIKHPTVAAGCIRRSHVMAFRNLASRLRWSSRTPSQALPTPTEPVVADGNPLTNVFTFSLSIVGELPFPGLKVAATVLLDIIRRVGSIDETKAALHELAAHMEYLLFLSSKVTGDVGDDAVRRLETAVAELNRNIPRDRNKIVAFFLADDTKSALQALVTQLNRTVSTFQIALQLNTDEKVEEVLRELKELKNKKHVSENPPTKRTLNFTVISVGRVDRNISHAKIVSGQDFHSHVIGADGVIESMEDVSIDADGDLNFTTVVGSPADLAAWSSVLKR